MEAGGPSFIANALPPGAVEHLRRDNPLLLDLKQRYARHGTFGHSQWRPETLRREVDLRYFRGDNAYSWQVRSGAGGDFYRQVADHARRLDRLGLWDRLGEDDLFGAYTFSHKGRHISRDLLDSIIQINFLERWTGLSQRPQATLLDIGAGYGRLAWRLSEAMPQLARVWCADGIAESTFLCDYYLGFRGASDAARVLPLDEAAKTLQGQRIDMATAIHSLSECTLAGIGWWLDLLDRTSITWLVVVPNVRGQLLNMEADGTRHDFQPLIEGHGFRLVAREDQLADANSLPPSADFMNTELWLFRRD